MKKTMNLKKFLGTLLIMVMLLSVCCVSASAAKVSVSLNKKKTTIYTGETQKLKATVKGSKKKVTWKSSKPSIATVNSSGKITAKKAGKTTITAKVGKKKATCTVTVKKANYKTAYAKFLSKHDTFSPPDQLFYDAAYSPKDVTFINEFFLCDLNKDKTPELITYTFVNFRWYIFRIYTYKNGKVTLMKSFDNNASANGSYVSYVCPKKHVHNNYLGGMQSEQTVYKVGSKVKEYVYYMYFTVYGYEGYQARLNGKACLEDKVLSALKGCHNLAWENTTNTSRNRELLKKGKCKVYK